MPTTLGISTKDIAATLNCCVGNASRKSDQAMTGLAAIIAGMDDVSPPASPRRRRVRPDNRAEQVTATLEVVGRLVCRHRREIKRAIVDLMTRAHRPSLSRRPS